VSKIRSEAATLLTSQHPILLTARELLLIVIPPLVLVLAWGAVLEILYLAVFMGALFVLVWSATSVHAWITIVILGHTALFMQKTEGVSLSEIVFALYFFGFIALWFFDRWSNADYSFSRSRGDRALFLFLLLATLSVFPALLHENKMELWLREWNVFLFLLLYFPLREILHANRGRVLVYGALVLVSAVIAVDNFIEYRAGALVAQFVWELIGARTAENEALSMAMVLGGTAAWINVRTKAGQLLSLVIVSLFTLALLLTFSRGYWIATLMGVCVIYYFSRREERRRLLWLLSIVVVAGSLTLLIFFYDIFTGLLSTLGYRFITASKGAADISLANRLVEYDAIWKAIQNNPIVGAGLGAEITFYSLLRKTTQHTIYSHNAYLYLWFKLGIAGLLVFLIAFVDKVREGIRSARVDQYFSDGSAEGRPFVLASVAILTAMLLLSFTSPQFYSRDSILVMSICWATIASSVNYSRAGAVTTE